MSVNSKMTAIADKIRTLSGIPGTMGMDEMATNLGVANTTVDTQANLLEQAIAALEGKAAGGIIPSGTLNISQNGTYSVYDYAQAKVNVPAQDPRLQAKSVTPAEAEQTVTPDSGYDGLSQVTVDAIPTAELQKPSMAANADGNVYATAQQPQGGYIAAGSRVTNVLKLSSAHDADFIASNIKNGVTIFGLTGTFEGGGLPTGVSTIATGTYTPTANQDNSFTIDHGLGVTPNFFVWILEEDISTTPVANLNICGALIRKQSKYKDSSSVIYNVHYFYRGYSSTPSIGGGSSSADNATFMSATSCMVICSSSYSMKAGYTYRWVAGVLDGIA